MIFDDPRYLYNSSQNNSCKLGATHFLNIGCGCEKFSPACANCFIETFPQFKGFGKENFNLNPNWACEVTSHNYDLGTLFCTSLSTDLFWEGIPVVVLKQYWEIVRNHPDYIFQIMTKRVDRILQCLPDDWDKGYSNVELMLTVENQALADYRLPIFETIPSQHKSLCCAPLLEDINIEKYLERTHFDLVQVGGETAPQDKVRLLDLKWVKHLNQQCKAAKIRFAFMRGGCKLKIDETQNLYIDPENTFKSKIGDYFNLNYYEPIVFHLKSGNITK